jgi:hypothetical protein
MAFHNFQRLGLNLSIQENLNYIMDFKRPQRILENSYFFEACCVGLK